MAGSGDDEAMAAATPAQLRTERLLLRGWLPADREPFAVLNADPQVTQYLLGPMQRDVSDAMVDRVIAEHTAVGYTLWAVQVLDSERGPAPFIGFVGLQRVPFPPPFQHSTPCVEVGWRLARRWWGMGLASEAAAAALRFAFNAVGLAEVVAFTLPDNARSQAVMRRIGMWPDGEFDHPRARPDDAWRRHLLFRIRPGDVSRVGVTEGGGAARRTATEDPDRGGDGAPRADSTP